MRGVFTGEKGLHGLLIDANGGAQMATANFYGGTTILGVSLFGTRKRIFHDC